MTTARWRMPEADHGAVEPSRQHTQDEVLAAADKARAELATKDNPLSDA